jgi:hypothetical protein
MQKRTPPAPAGWYDDPSRPGGQSYWDGRQWTADFRERPREPAPDQPGTVSFANGGILHVAADAPGSVRLEAWHLEAGTYSVTLTSRDIYNLSNAMVDALHPTRGA